MIDDLPPRLRAKVEIEEDSGCWIWLGAGQKNGYGHVWFDGKYRRAHRVLYEWKNGAIAAGLVVHHKCRRKRCVNPAHLEAVSFRDNLVADNTMVMQHATKTHCFRGHPLSGDNLTVRIWRKRVQRECNTCRRLRSAKRRDIPEAKRKRTARERLHYAVKAGRLRKLPCFRCGSIDSEAHHSDYSKPLEVVWACRSHHRELHAA